MNSHSPGYCFFQPMHLCRSALSIRSLRDSGFIKLLDVVFFNPFLILLSFAALGRLLSNPRYSLGAHSGSNPATFNKRLSPAQGGVKSFGGGRWIRTTVDRSQRVYSPPPLATRAPLRRLTNKTSPCSETFIKVVVTGASNPRSSYPNTVYLQLKATRRSRRQTPKRKSLGSMSSERGTGLEPATLSLEG